MNTSKNALKEVIHLLKDCLEESKNHSDKGLAGQCLIHGTSFQLTSDASMDRWIGFRELARANRRWSVHQKGFKKNGDSKSLLCLGAMGASPAVIDYIKYSSSEEVGFVFSRDEITAWEREPILTRITFLIFSLNIAWRCFFSSKRTNLALLIRAAQINYFLIKKVEQLKVESVYNFVPFEIDSNFQSLLLRSYGVKVTFIPSSGPLGTWNQTMICDKVVFSTPYHDEERIVFANTMRFDTVLRWGPEKAYGYIHRYLENRPLASPKTIGFYSHGSWLRLRLGHVQTKMNLAGAEDQCALLIKAFLEKRPEYSLIVFAHPREKSDANWEETQRHFNQLFKGYNWKFADKNLPSSHAFEAADIGISTFSTIVYERLYAGYKTLICNYGINNFPMENSTLNSITFDTIEQLVHQAEKCSVISEEKYFEEKDLRGYRHEKLNSLL